MLISIQPTAEIEQFFVHVCQSHGQQALLAVLYSYKGLLQVTALILAFRTRKVKVKGLDDSKYIAAAIYITSIVLAVIIVATYTLADYVNVFPAVVGAGFLLGTTIILVLVFVPKVSMDIGYEDCVHVYNWTGVALHDHVLTMCLLRIVSACGYFTYFTLIYWTT